MLMLSCFANIPSNHISDKNIEHTFPVKLHSGECQNTSVMISQHWFREWLGGVRQEAITRNNDDQNNVDAYTHYADVIMGPIASQITSLTIVYSIVYQTQIKENIKAPRHWPLCGEFTGTGEFPAQRASYAENVSI